MEALEQGLREGFGRMVIHYPPRMGKTATAIAMEDMMKDPTHWKRTCVYCGEKCEEVGGQRLWPAREDLFKDRFLVCWNCSAHVSMNEEGAPRGYPAKQHIRELRSMILSAWHAVCNTGAMTWDKADGFRRHLKAEHGFDISEMGWLEEEELRLLLSILDRMVIPDTPEVDALFKD